jgi:hypothetical protein
MTSEHESLIDIAQTGWFIAIAAATWGIILRWLVGRHDRANERLEARLNQLEADMTLIKESLASIAGRLLERDHYGRHTWPGDSR